MLFCQRCVCCGELLPLFSKARMCRECAADASVISGKVFGKGNISRLKSFYEYTGSVRKALVSFKYLNNADAGHFMAMKLAGMLKNDGEIMTAEIVICVPNGKYETERLYNQSEFLAKRVAKLLDMKYVPSVLKKKRGVKSQLRCVTRAERRINVKNAFSVIKAEAVKGKRVLIIDDITTTGATLTECADALTRAGAKEVFAATAAKTPSSAPKPVIKFLDVELTFMKKPTVHYRFTINYSLPKN